MPKKLSSCKNDRSLSLAMTSETSKSTKSICLIFSRYLRAELGLRSRGKIWWLWLAILVMVRAPLLPPPSSAPTPSAPFPSKTSSSRSSPPQFRAQSQKERKSHQKLMSSILNLIAMTRVWKSNARLVIADPNLRHSPPISLGSNPTTWYLSTQLVSATQTPPTFWFSTASF